MKVLLTSAGLMNESLKRAFTELVGKMPEDTSVVFVTTASNVETGDKSWVIKDLQILKEMGLKEIMMTDISAVPESVWRPQLERADAMIFEGGNTFHLMEWISKSGLDVLLPDLLKTRVWVGISAGSMVACPDLSIKMEHKIYGESLDRTADIRALGLADVYVLPHLKDGCFKGHDAQSIKEILKEYTKPVYGLDDQSGIKIVDGNAEVISEGAWFRLN